MKQLLSAELFRKAAENEGANPSPSLSDDVTEHYDNPYGAKLDPCAYSLWNPHLMLVSGLGQPQDPATGEGVVGRNYSYQTITGLSMFFDGEHDFNASMGSGALGILVDDYNGDNFDHTDPASCSTPGCSRRTSATIRQAR